MRALIVTSGSAFFQRTSGSLWARKMSFPQWFTWMKRRRICTFSMCPQGRRLNANKIYTRQSLRKLQSELPAYLQSRGFAIERGVEQMSGSAQKHLDTREFKQQKEELARLARKPLP